MLEYGFLLLFVFLGKNGKYGQSSPYENIDLMGSKKELNKNPTS
jgi:hypothetical protein